MASEYDPLFHGSADRPGDPRTADDLDRVHEAFEFASRPYLRSPLSWLAWAVVLPIAAALNGEMARGFGLRGVVLLWSLAILVGGMIEMATIFRARGHGRRTRSTPLASWVFRMQGNLSMVALALSVLLVWNGLGRALPALWLLLVGHSFYLLGGLAFAPFRLYGLAYQIGGLLALWPTLPPLGVFAGVTAAANLWMAFQVWRTEQGSP